MAPSSGHEAASSQRSLAERAMSRAFGAREGEAAAMLWSGLYHFCLLSGYYVIRPIREAMGIEGGVRDLKYLYIGTFVAITLCNPLFWALVTRLPRRRFIPIVYHFFALNLLVFFVLFEVFPEGERLHVGRVFYVWTSVFNLFVISVFWQFMADLYRSDQGKRLFGFIAAGGSLGAIAGAGCTSLLAESVGATRLMLISVLLLECAVFCVARLFRLRSVGETAHGAPAAQREPAGGMWEGLLLLV